MHLRSYDRIKLEVCDHYQKQTYRNRCYILSSQQTDTLIIPVQHTGAKMLYRDVKIDERQAWRKRHWRALCTSYRKAPYFDYYEAYFEAIFRKPHTFLVDFNMDMLLVCFELLGLEPSISFTTSYEPIGAATCADYRGVLHAKRNSTGHQREFMPYKQVFGQAFVPNLSTIDLLCCEGPQALGKLQPCVEASLRGRSGSG